MANVAGEVTATVSDATSSEDVSAWQSAADLTAAATVATGSTSDSSKTKVNFFCRYL